MQPPNYFDPNNRNPLLPAPPVHPPTPTTSDPAVPEAKPSKAAIPLPFLLPPHPKVETPPRAVEDISSQVVQHATGVKTSTSALVTEFHRQTSPLYEQYNKQDIPIEEYERLLRELFSKLSPSSPMERSLFRQELLQFYLQDNPKDKFHIYEVLKHEIQLSDLLMPIQKGTWKNTSLFSCLAVYHKTIFLKIWEKFQGQFKSAIPSTYAPKAFQELQADIDTLTSDHISESKWQEFHTKYSTLLDSVRANLQRTTGLTGEMNQNIQRFITKKISEEQYIKELRRICILYKPDQKKLMLASFKSFGSNTLPPHVFLIHYKEFKNSLGLTDLLLPNQEGPRKGECILHFLASNDSIAFVDACKRFKDQFTAEQILTPCLDGPFKGTSILHLLARLDLYASFREVWEKFKDQIPAELILTPCLDGPLKGTSILHQITRLDTRLFNGIWEKHKDQITAEHILTPCPDDFFKGTSLLHFLAPFLDTRVFDELWEQFKHLITSEYIITPCRQEGRFQGMSLLHTLSNNIAMFHKAWKKCKYTISLTDILTPCQNGLSILHIAARHKVAFNEVWEKCKDTISLTDILTPSQNLEGRFLGKSLLHLSCTHEGFFTVYDQFSDQIRAQFQQDEWSKFQSLVESIRESIRKIGPTERQTKEKWKKAVTPFLDKLSASLTAPQQTPSDTPDAQGVSANLIVFGRQASPIFEQYNAKKISREQHILKLKEIFSNVAPASLKERSLFRQELLQHSLQHNLGNQSILHLYEAIKSEIELTDLLITAQSGQWLGLSLFHFLPAPQFLEIFSKFQDTITLKDLTVPCKTGSIFCFLAGQHPSLFIKMWEKFQDQIAAEAARMDALATLDEIQSAVTSFSTGFWEQANTLLSQLQQNNSLKEFFDGIGTHLQEIAPQAVQQSDPFEEFRMQFSKLDIRKFDEFKNEFKRIFSLYAPTSQKERSEFRKKTLRLFFNLRDDRAIQSFKAFFQICKDELEIGELLAPTRPDSNLPATKKCVSALHFLALHSQATFVEVWRKFNDQITLTNLCTPGSDWAKPVSSILIHLADKKSRYLPEIWEKYYDQYLTQQSYRCHLMDDFQTYTAVANKDITAANLIWEKRSDEFKSFFEEWGWSDLQIAVSSKTELSKAPSPPIAATSSSATIAPLTLSSPITHITPLTLESLQLKNHPNIGPYFTELVDKFTALIGPGSPDAKAFAEVLKKQRCTWSFELNNLSFDLGGKIINLIAAEIEKNDSPARISALHEIVNFFDFRPRQTIANPLEILQNKGKDPIARAMALFALSASVSPPISKTPLSQESVDEIYLTLYANKFKELTARSRYFKEWHANETKSPREIPCYVMAKDAGDAKVFITSASFDSRGRLTGFYEDVADSAHAMLTTFCPTADKKIATLTSDEVKKLHDTALRSIKTPFLLLQREHPKILTEIAAKPPALPSEKPPQQPKLRRSPEAEQPSVTPKTKPLVPAKPQVQLVEQVPDRKSPTSASNKQAVAVDPTFATEFKSLDQLSKGISINKSSSSAASNDALEPQGHLTVKVDAPRALESFNEFWDFCTKEASLILSTELALDSNKTRAFETKPLSHPIIAKMATLSKKPTKFPLLNPLLKNYQIREAANILHLNENGLTPILSFDMGLGKTPVAQEILSQQMMKSDNQNHLFVMRKGILHSAKNDIEKFTLESQRQAWAISLKLDRAKTEPLWLNKLAKILSNPKRPIELENLISLSHYIDPKNLAIRLNAIRSTLDCDKLSKFLSGAVKTRIDLIASHSSDKDMLKARFAACLAYLELPNTPKHPLNDELKRRLTAACVDSSTFEFADLLKSCSTLRASDQSQNILTNLFSITGILLNYHPTRQPPPTDLSQYSLDGLKRVIDFDLDRIVICDKKSFEFELKKGDKSTIYFVTPQTLKACTELAAEKINGFFGLDEAQDYKNENMNNEAINEFNIRRKKKHPSASNLVISATPYENNLAELFNLCALANPDFFDKAMFKSIEMLTKKLITSLTIGRAKSEVYDEARTIQRLSLLYAHMKVFLGSIQGLVSTLHMSDALVAKNWNNIVPTKKEIKHHVSDKISATALSVLQKKDASYLERASKSSVHAIAYKHAVIATLTHPSWAETGGMDIKTNEKLRSDLAMFKKGTDRVGMQKWIDESPLFSALFTNDSFKTAAANKEKSLIFVEHEATGQILELALKHLHGIKSGFYSGSTTDSHAAIVHGFKKGDLQVFIATPKSGGAGLNLNEADGVYFLGYEWNPAITAQAAARAVRIGCDTREHKIHHFLFGTEFEFFHNAVMQDKEALREFADEQTFEAFCKFIRATAYHQIYNETKNGLVAAEQIDIIDKRLALMRPKIKEADLLKLIQQVTPTVSKTSPVPTASKVSSSSPVQVAFSGIRKEDMVIIPMRRNDNLKRAYMAGLMAKHEPKRFEKIRELLKDNPDELLARARLYQWQGTEMNPNAVAIQQELDAMIANIRDAATKLTSIPSNVRYYELKEGKYVVDVDTTEEDPVELLISKVETVPGKFEDHFDLLLRK